MAIDTHSWPGISADKRGWGPGWPNCQFDLWVTAPKPIFGKIHEDILELLTLLVTETGRRGYKLKGDGLTAGTSQCWGAECRAIKEPDGGMSNVPSNHSWGLAVDLNSVDNGYGGTKHDIPQWMAELWNSYGFRWGGSWSANTKDWMHFDFMGTPADAVAMTQKARTELGGDELTDEESKKLNFLNSLAENLGARMVKGWVKNEHDGGKPGAAELADAIGDALGAPQP